MHCVPRCKCIVVISAVSVRVCMFAWPKKGFSPSAFLFSSSPIISVPHVAPQGCPLYTTPNKTTNKPFCILIKTIRIGYWVSFYSTLRDTTKTDSHFSTILSCGGFTVSIFKTLIHKTSAFVNTGAVCSHVINPSTVIGIERNQSMLIASMEIKTHGHCSAQRIRYGVK